MQRRYRLWLLRNRVKGVLHCYCVTGNSRWRLAVESSPAKRHTPTLHDPLLLLRTAKTAARRFQEEIVRSSCDSSILRTQNLLETLVSVLPPTLCRSRTRLNR